jgi:hypothetical protein
MNAKLETFDSGWVGLSLALGNEEIDLLLRRLNELKSGDINHFHLRNEDFESKEGMADIEITTMGKNEQNNMTID